MHQLTKLFKLFELTRSQVQQGYILARVRKYALSDLAQHHYLVSIIGWQLACLAKRAGAKIDNEKVLELCLVHDLGELLGGDIGKYYANANPRARKLAKAFESENQRFLTQFFGSDARHIVTLFREVMVKNTDEGKIMNIADRMECAHYLIYLNNFERPDFDIIKSTLTIARQLKDRKARQAITAFLRGWSRDIKQKSRKKEELLWQS